MTLPVYSLFEFVIMEPIPLFIGCALIFPAFVLCWKLAGFLLANGPEPPGFIGSWCLAARIFLFWLAFTYIMQIVADRMLYATDETGFSTLKVLDREKDRETILACAKYARLRETESGPKMVWFDAFRVGSCVRSWEEKKLLGKKYKIPEKNFIDLFFDALEK